MEKYAPGDVEQRPCFDLVLRDARLLNGEGVDIAIAGDTIVAIGSISGVGTRELPLGGRVVLPGFVEAHTHLDKAMTVAQSRNNSGTLLEAMAVMCQVQR
ncbi:MAG: cytosine deaminase-like metal-dependent hydrolase, partial [Chloroflexi bacterium]|nr:cytosine deaminase-like metal-dependent hydrolase [Chloroflexota bacterium]